MEKITVTLISGRTSRQGVGLEVGKTSEEYFESVSYIELSAGDAESLGVGDGDHVKVETAHGSVVVSVKLSDKLEPGTSFFPYGIWANQVFGSETGGTGMPQFKGVEAEVTPSGAGVPSLADLVATLKGGS
ncbi:MAG: tRNA CCA-pyrophosphorylase [Candidatus Bathyarchaeota archaeon]|nr:tRNA CCA-pyrophosphorylase [Candidatus Bathyarchaeota archaeon]